VAASFGMLRQLPTRGRKLLPKLSPTPPETTIASSPTTVTMGDQSQSDSLSTPPALDTTVQVQDDTHVHDIVISGGRVIDPGSRFDAIAHVGIDGATITRISLEPLLGAQTIDAKNLVVSPGFIDILSYPLNGYGEWFKVADGVTSNLCLHGIDDTMIDFLSKTDRYNPPINYGGATDQYEHRKKLGINLDWASKAEIAELANQAETDLIKGAIGIHQQPEYTLGLTFEEMLTHAKVAANHNVPLCLHLRHSRINPADLQEEGVNEAIRLAQETGCQVHIEHINSTGGTGRMQDALYQIETAQAEGLSITACIYPYTYWATYAASARFDDFQDKYGIGYNDLQVANSSSRITAAEWPEIRRKNLLTAAFAMSEADITEALSAPWVMVGSDAILTEGGNNHPRSTGCFSRLLGVYARDRGVLNLSDALARITILPSKLLESVSSGMAKRGRIQAGAIADITIFDPVSIKDQSTISSTGMPSEGVQHVLVGGRFVRQNGANNKTERPGIAIIRDIT